MPTDPTRTPAGGSARAESGGEGKGSSFTVALTAYARVEDRLQAPRSGFQMHVPKPVEMAELIAVAAGLFSRGE